MRRGERTDRVLAAVFLAGMVVGHPAAAGERHGHAEAHAGADHGEAVHEEDVVRLSARAVARTGFAPSPRPQGG